MQISARILDGVDLIELSGRATADAHLRLRELFVEKVEEGRRRFIIKMSEAEFLDSLLLGELVACYKRTAERQGTLKLVVTPNGMAHELLQLTGLDSAFQIYGQENEAAASFN